MTQPPAPPPTGPPQPQPSNSQVYQQSLIDAREAWAKQSGITVAQVKAAYSQAATSLGARAAAAPPTAPSTAWNLNQYQQVMNEYAATLDQRVLDAMHLGISASFHDSADSVLKTKSAEAYGSVFGPEAIDAYTRDINQRAAATYMTRTGLDGIKLSDRVWKANQQWRGAIQSVVQDAVTSGRPPVQVAREIEQYLAPGVNVPYKAETAKRLRVPKDTSMPAMRVARTEMQNSFHEGTISSHSSMPSYLGIRWHIASGGGHVTDICDEYAAHGFYEKGSEPLKPHPHCFCTAIPVHRDADEVLADLEDWLHDPKSHADLEDYYQRLKPLLDVEVASVAGAAGGPLLGGYAKGEKVLIDVKGTEVIATIVGEHASKGVLTLTIDPGQGMQSIKVWRAPTKVKAYAGPPTEPVPLTTGPPPTAAPTMPSPQAMGVGDAVYATKGQHTGKVGHITSIDQAGGTYHIEWTDGTANNVVFSNLEKAPPPPALLPGDLVKLHMPEQPQLDGQLATIAKINADASYTVAVNLQGQQLGFDLPHVASFKLELLPPPAPPGAAQPVPEPFVSSKPILGYVDMPGTPHHGKAVIDKLAQDAVAFQDGTFAYNAAGFNVVAHDPLAAPPPAPPTPQHVPVPTPKLAVGDHVQIDMPGAFAHGQQGTVTGVSPTGYVQVQLADGTHEYFSGPEITEGKLKPLGAPPTNVGPQVPTSQGIDHLKVGAKVLINDTNSPIYGQEVLLNMTPHPSIPEVEVFYPPTGTTFHMNKSMLLEPGVGTAAAGASRKLATLDDLQDGDQVVVNDPSSPHHGKTMFISETPAWYAGNEQMSLFDTLEGSQIGDVAAMVQKSKLEVVPGTLKHAETPLHQLLAGDEVMLTKNSLGWKKGDKFILQQDILGKQPGALVSGTAADGSVVDFYVADLAAVPKAKGKLLEDVVKGDKLVITDPSDANFGKTVEMANASWQNGSSMVNVFFEDGSIGTFGKSALGLPPEAAPAPGPAPVPVQAVQGTVAQINDPNDAMHGEQVVITQTKPSAGPNTPIQVTYTTGPNTGQSDFFVLKNLVEPGASVVHAPTPANVPQVLPGVVDVTVKGTKIVTDYKGMRNVTGTVQSYNQGKNVLVIKPDNPVPGLSATTFTKNPKKVKAIQPEPPVAPTEPPPAPPPQQTQTNVPGPTQHPPGSIDHLQPGDKVIVNMPGTSMHGEEAVLVTTPHGANSAVGVEYTTGPNAGVMASYFASDLVPPGTPVASPAGASLAHPPEPGGTATYAGQVEVKLLEPSSAASWKVELPDGAVVSVPTTVLTEFKPPSAAAPPPEPPAVTPVPTTPPVPTVPTQKVTDKGALVTTEYQGKFVQAVVKSYNASKNNVVLSPIPGSDPSLPKTFGKTPQKLTLVTPPTVVPAPPPAVPTTTPAPSSAAAPKVPTSLPPDPPQPVVSSFKTTNQSVGGGHVKSLFEAPDGSTWMFKPDATAAAAEKSGYNVQALLGLETPEMHLMTVGGQPGSMQRFHQGIQGEVRFNTISSLTDKQRQQIQEHQVVDWLISQHDSNQGAMLIGANGDILAVDKGQAFKFLGKDRLDWKYAPNMDGVLYKPLFEGYITGKYDLDRAAIEPILAKVEALDDDLFKEAVKPYAQHAARQGYVASEQAFYDTLLERKHNIRKDFAKLYDDADKQAGKPPRTAPATPPPARPVPVPTVTTNVVTPIARPNVEAITQTGHAGRSFMVGGEDIESGNVLAYTLKKPDGSRKLVLEMRVRSHAEPKLLAKLDGVTHVAAAGTPTDPFWNQMLVVVKHVGYHLKEGSTGKDGKLGDDKMMQMQALAKDINSGNMDRDKAEHYSMVLSTLTGWSAAEIATQPLSALKDQTVHWWGTSTAVQSAHFDPYTPVVKSTTATAPPDKVQAKTETPWAYQRSLSPEGELLTTDAKAVGRAAGHEGAAVHTLTMDTDTVGTYMPWNQGGNMLSKQGKLTIVKDNYQGTEAEVQQAMDQIKRLGLDSDLATPEDIELLYLRHQAHAMKLEEAPEFKAGVTNKITATMTTVEKIRVHKEFWNKKLGVADVAKLPAYQPTAQFDQTYRPVGANGNTTTEGGWAYFNRFDMSEHDLKQSLKGWGLTQSARSGAEGLTRTILNGNGMMSPTEERIRTGVYSSSQGMSSSADMGTGGASYTFTRLATPSHFGRGQFIFDPKLLLRTDMITYDGDRFGRSDKLTKRERRVDVNGWKTAEHSGSNEAIFKNGFPFLEYIQQIRCSTSAERTRTIRLFKERGISEVRGIKVEDLVVVA